MVTSSAPEELADAASHAAKSRELGIEEDVLRQRELVARLEEREELERSGRVDVALVPEAGLTVKPGVVAGDVEAGANEGLQLSADRLEPDDTRDVEPTAHLGHESYLVASTPDVRASEESLPGAASATRSIFPLDVRGSA